MDKINWDATREEVLLIAKIANRAVKLLGVDKFDTQMSITAVHLNDCELDLDKLYKADDFNFTHDIGGITRNIDTQTGTLINCFVPRCMKH